MAQFKMDDFWMGPNERNFNEGFDELFKVKQDYKIPEPELTVQNQLDKMQEGDSIVGGRFTQAKGFKEAMDSVFGSWIKGKKEDKTTEEIIEFGISSTETKQETNTSSVASRLQLVQSGNSSMNIVVTEPRAFEDSLEIVNHLKTRKTVIVNLQYLERDVSQRVIDFVSGATLALDGSQERVGHGVFIFASMNTNLETESEGMKAYKDLFSKTFG
ncbi:MAG: cell division protein SepF [Cyanobacteria bacterium]|nr:cell division protein SepF [Cyanobacteriota bacterium]MDA1021664.1 cell division protein SepF [Cyanobacteriota bacterium]